MEPITFDWIVVAAIVATVAVLISAGTATFLRRPRRLRITKSARLWVPPSWLEEQTNRLNGVDTDEALLALDALESHAQNRPERRSAVAAILCEHLRRSSSRDGGRRTRAVQRVLTGHARATARGEHWAGLDLDLNRSRLQDLDLSHAQVGGLSLVGATLAGATQLGGMSCAGTFDASGALFEGLVEAEPLVVHGHTRLADAAFTSRCNFAGAVFGDVTDMTGAVFAGPVWFTDAVFIGPVTLSNARDSASFDGPVDLQRAACGTMNLRGVEFPGGLTIGRMDADLPQVVEGDEPDLARIVRGALHYPIGDGDGDHDLPERAAREASPRPQRNRRA